MYTPTGEIVARARSAGGGAGAFNVITVEHAEAIVTGAERAGLPVILQISENAGAAVVIAQVNSVELRDRHSVILPDDAATENKDFASRVR